MKAIGIFAVWACAADWAIASGDVPASGVMDIEESAEAAIDSREDLEPWAQGFTGTQLARLRELRAWLTDRKLERDGGSPASPRSPGPNLAVYPDRQLLTPLGQRYALGFQDRRHAQRTPDSTLYIGRGSDGRIYHRYVFGSAEISSSANGSNPRVQP